MTNKKVSIILFYDKKGNILLQDRRERSKHGEEYGFFGGKFEQGETPEQALEREIFEELTIKIKNYKLFKHTIGYSPWYGENSERFLFIAPMPDMKKVIVKEGKLAPMKFKDSFSLKMLEGHIELLKEAYEYLKKKKIITE